MGIDNLVIVLLEEEIYGRWKSSFHVSCTLPRPYVEVLYRQITKSPHCITDTQQPQPQPHMIINIILEEHMIRDCTDTCQVH